MKEIILAKYGEIILKGGNRPKFENILMNNIRNSLKNVAEVKARLAQATIYVEVFDEDKMDIVVEYSVLFRLQERLFVKRILRI